MRACDVLTSKRRRKSRRSSTIDAASASISSNGAPVRFDILSAKTTRSSAGAFRRPSISSRARTAGTPHAVARETRMNSVRTGSRERSPTNRMAWGREWPDPKEMASAPKASGIPSSSASASRRRRRLLLASKANTGTDAHAGAARMPSATQPTHPETAQASNVTPRASSSPDAPRADPRLPPTRNASSTTACASDEAALSASALLATPPTSRNQRRMSPKAPDTASDAVVSESREAPVNPSTHSATRIPTAPGTTTSTLPPPLRSKLRNGAPPR